MPNLIARRRTADIAPPPLPDRHDTPNWQFWSRGRTDPRAGARCILGKTSTTPMLLCGRSAGNSPAREMANQPGRRHQVSPVARTRSSGTASRVPAMREPRTATAPPPPGRSGTPSAVWGAQVTAPSGQSRSLLTAAVMFRESLRARSRPVPPLCAADDSCLVKKKEAIPIRTFCASMDHAAPRRVHDLAWTVLPARAGDQDLLHMHVERARHPCTLGRRSRGAATEGN
jgi:hypothetical protein